MSRSDLILFKEKYNVSDYFTQVVGSLLDKLVEFEYVSNFKVSSLVDTLLKNVKELKIAGNNQYDYKSGYYDANKKELYIKDEKNIPAVYLRLLYALTTTEIEDNVYMCGYSTTKLRKDSYKLSYNNFGTNRAVMANLVYKLCNLVPPTLQITPVTKTYTHNFLGYEIVSANDIYSLEGKILAELCFVLDLDPEILYAGLFTKNPVKHLESIFHKKGFDDSEKFSKLFDKISRNYNTYNKLVFLSTKLNDNYLEYKKHVLSNDVDNIKKEQQVIEEHIASVLSVLYPKTNNNELGYEDNESAIGLSEAIDKLEAELKAELIKIQDILANTLITNSKHLSYSKYAGRLKCFNDILIVPNKKIQKAIEQTILFKLMPEDEVTGINLVQKIKYALIEEILSESNYSDTTNKFTFYNITNFENADNGTTLIILNSGKSFSRIMEISGLDNNKHYNFKLKPVVLDNLGNAMNSNYSDIYIGDIEKLYTAIKQNFNELTYLSMDNIFVFEYLNKKYLYIFSPSNPHIIEYSYNGKEYAFNALNLSEEYKVFGKGVVSKNIFKKSNLPILYK